MEKKKEFLTEENYQRGKQKVVLTALIVLIIGVLLGGCLIMKGISNSKKVNSTYSEESKQSKIDDLNLKIDAEKRSLEIQKSELERKNIIASSNYENGEAYDLYIIKKVLDPSFSYCSFGEYKNNPISSKYCSLKSELEDVERMNMDFQRDMNSFDSIPFYMFGAFIIIASCMISGSIYMFAKRREILAFSAQQIMPVAQEGIEKMAPTVGKAGASIAKEMAPAFGNIAKEISKGLKDGINGDKENNDEKDN